MSVRTLSLIRPSRRQRGLVVTFGMAVVLGPWLAAQDTQLPELGDRMREMQTEAMTQARADWGHWGNVPEKYSTWTYHSNRLIPVYTFGLTLDSLRSRGSAYRDRARLEELYGHVPEGTLNPTARYHDQTDLYRLQQEAVDAGYRQVIVFVLDGMDWQTTRAAAVYATGKSGDELGRGTGLSFLDYRGGKTDFGLVVTSPRMDRVRFDVDSQLVLDGEQTATGGYDPSRGGEEPWREESRSGYLLGLDRERPHSVPDSASTATSLTSGIKTYNGAINVAVDGRQLEPIGRELQREQDFRVGIVSDVPVSHATPAAAYANNVTRQDYQDIARDLLGLPSSAHREDPLAGVDVLIGAGWGEHAEQGLSQGANFQPGNPYLHESDLRRSRVEQGGRYVVAERTAERDGREVLMEAAKRAVQQDDRLLGFFGTKGGHLPFRTADGGYNPTIDVAGSENYNAADLLENPTLADMTEAALMVLEHSLDGFWLLIEAGDVDWANHANNLDNSIGSVLGGAAAFTVLTDWIERNHAWGYTAVIVTADHGHYLVITEPSQIAAAGK